LAPSSKNWTVDTPAVAVAVAVTVIVPDTVAPFAGEVMETVGGVVPFELFTVTVTFVLVPVLPAASCAIALRECEPLLALVVSHEYEYGDAVTTPPTFAPSIWN
jgi:hypothetical protein